MLSRFSRTRELVLIYYSLQYYRESPNKIKMKIKKSGCFKIKKKYLSL